MMGVRIPPVAVYRVTIGKSGRSLDPGVLQCGIYELYTRKTHAQLWAVGAVGRESLGDETAPLFGDCPVKTEKGFTVSTPVRQKKVWLWKVCLPFDWSWGRPGGRWIVQIQQLKLDPAQFASACNAPQKG